MATTYDELLIRHLCDDGKYRLFKRPAWLTDERLLSGEKFNIEKFEEFTDLKDKDTLPAGVGTNCGVVVPPADPTVPPKPTWNVPALLATMPAKIPGSPFSWLIDMNQVGTAGVGATLSGIRISAGPDYLSLIQMGGGIYKIYGTVKPSINFDEGIDLVLEQTYTVGDLATGSETLQNVNIPLASNDFYALYSFAASANKLVPRVGPRAGANSLPQITFFDPDGLTDGSQLMAEAGTGALQPTGKEYFYAASVSNPKKGNWLLKIDFLGKTRYGLVNVPAGEVGYTEVALSATQPAAPTQPTAKPVVQLVDEEWYRAVASNPNAANRVILYAKISLGADMVIQQSWEGTNNTWQTLPGNYRITNDAKGYTHKFDNNYYFGAVVDFKIYPKDYPENAVTFRITVPSAPANSTARAQVYPPVSPPPVDQPTGGGGGGSTITTYTFTGQQLGGYPSGDTGVLDLTASFQNGRVYLTDHATPGGGTPKYLVNSDGYFDTLQGMSFPPDLPILIQKFIIDGSQPQENWRDQSHARNAAQVIRIL